jgi:dCTP diphosphatase
MAEPLAGSRPIDDLDALRERLREFVVARDWGQFHGPKNLAMALVVEAGELMEPFQWLDEAESAALPADKLEAVRLEMADVLLYLVQLADVLGVDLLAAAADKIEINEGRYPAERVRGRATKYDEL